MSPVNRVIIDTDPGVDDILAVLLALAAKPEEIEVILLSITFGNVEVQSCLRNVVSMFHVLEQELAWRKTRSQLEGFDALKHCCPIVAVGAEKPLEDQLMMADYFHGTDGLGGIHSSHPHLTPKETWKTLFQPPPAHATVTETSASPDLATPSNFFKPSHVLAHREILRLLKESEKDTVTIVAIGPLTNLALAAAEDPETFLKAKELVVMGGAIEIEGNITPVAEFNTYADSVAAARVLALTSPSPTSTFPPAPPPSSHSPSPPYLPGYPATLSTQLKLTLFPLDVTTTHWLRRTEFEAKVQPLVKQGSPLAEWVSAFVGKTFEKINSLHEGRAHLSLHDPLCIWYVLTSTAQSWHLSPSSPEDIRVETSGQWTRGMCVVDRRSRKRAEEGQELPGDSDGWLSPRKGNRVRRMVSTPGEDNFAPYLLQRIFG